MLSLSYEVQSLGFMIFSGPGGVTDGANVHEIKGPERTPCQQECIPVGCIPAEC